MMPALFLKKMVMGNFDRSLTDSHIADSIDFLVEKVKHFTHILYSKSLQLIFSHGYELL